MFIWNPRNSERSFFFHYLFFSNAAGLSTLCSTAAPISIRTSTKTSQTQSCASIHKQSYTLAKVKLFDARQQSNSLKNKADLISQE